jgi:transcriptional regulator with XRE-family HTH domain
MKTHRWDDIKARDPAGNTPEYRAAYAQARRDLRLGMRVRELREAAGLSQSELARRTGTRQPNIARLEAGGGIPKLETLQRVADALDMELQVSFRPAKRTRATTKAAPAKRISATTKETPTKTASAKALAKTTATAKATGVRTTARAGGVKIAKTNANATGTATAKGRNPRRS